MLGLARGLARVFRVGYISRNGTEWNGSSIKCGTEV